MGVGYNMSDSSNSFKGHHGTLESCFRLIEKEGFRCSKKNNEWLGWGIYFFAEYEDAQWWANNESLKKTKRGQKPCVITALVKYKNNEYLDLDVRADKREFDKLAADLSAKLKVSLHFKTAAQWRCYYSNLVFRSTTVKILSYTVPTGGKDKFGFPYQKRQHCVSDNQYIEVISGKVV